MMLDILLDLRSALLERASLEDLPEAIWKRTAALNTWGTNAVEGSTITLEDARRLILRGESVPGKPIRDVLETLQHERTFRSLPEQRSAPMGLKLILSLHESVFRGILPDAGQYRRVNVRVEGAAFTPPRMEKVVPELEKFEREYGRRRLRGEDVFRLGAWMHFEFERIHPFTDGNGRVGRLLLNLHFLGHNWPPVHVLPGQRDTYLEGLNRFAREDPSPLEDFLRVLAGASLVDLLDQAGTAKDELLGLKEVSKFAPYGPKYLALRCQQGVLPAVKEKGEWRTSKRAVGLYVKHLSGRSTRTC
jgi:fido (protein-threonine AMPylation protein)